MGLYTVLFVLLHCSISVSAQVTFRYDDDFGGSDNCTEDKELDIEAFIGWPYKISCNRLIEAMDAAMYDDTYDEYDEEYVEDSGVDEYPSSDINAEYDDNVGTCVVREQSSGIVLHNATVSNDLEELNSYVIEFTVDSPTCYVVEYRLWENDRCLYQNVKLEKKVEQNLNESLNYDGRLSATLGSLIEPGCFVPEYMDQENFTYKWKFDNEETLPSNAKLLNDGFNLQLQNISFANAGNYSCLLQYKGMALNSITHHVCVKYKTAHKITLSCPEEQPAVIGRNVTIQCTADHGIGQVGSHHSLAIWSRLENTSNILCESGESEVKESGESYECSMKSSIQGKACYGKKPPDVVPQDIYNINLTIRNTRLSDLGKITLNYSFAGNQFYKIITLTEDISGITEFNAYLALFALTAFIILILVGACLLRERHDIIWLWRKKFGAYDTESFPYTAYLVYHYHREMAQSSKIYTLVQYLCGFIKKLGGRPYNDAEEPRLLQFDAQHIPEVQRRCHRIIIILSPEFVTDQRSMEQTYMTLNVAVETGKKIIFIEMPGAKKQIELLEFKQRNTLKYAMKSKRNTTIPWGGKTPFDSYFRHRLENALPKLRPVDEGTQSASFQTSDIVNGLISQSSSNIVRNE